MLKKLKTKPYYEKFQNKQKIDFICNLTLCCIHLDTMWRNIDILFFMVKFICTVCSLTKMHFCFGTWKPIFFGPSIKIYHMHEKQVRKLTFRLANTPYVLTYILGLKLDLKFLQKLVNWKILLTFWMILRMHTIYRHGSCYKHQ